MVEDYRRAHEMQMHEQYEPWMKAFRSALELPTLEELKPYEEMIMGELCRGNRALGYELKDRGKVFAQVLVDIAWNIMQPQDLEKVTQIISDIATFESETTDDLAESEGLRQWWGGQFDRPIEQCMADLLQNRHLERYDKKAVMSQLELDPLTRIRVLYGSFSPAS